MDTEKPRIVFVTGAPGTGKGTQCARLVEELGFKHISIGDLMRAEVASGSEEGLRVRSIVQSGGLVPKELTVTLLHKALTSIESRGVLIDGFPRSVDQAIFLEETGLSVDFILHFEASDERALIERLIERGKTSGRADDNEETIVKRFNVYKAESMPVLELYEPFGVIRKVDCLATLPEVFKRTVCALRPELICVVGPAFSGKTTVAQYLSSKLYFHYVNINSLLEVVEFGRKRTLRTDEEIARAVVEALQKLTEQTRVVLDGFPMNFAQAQLFASLVGSPNAYVYMNTPKDVCQERVQIPSTEFSKIHAQSLDPSLVKYAQKGTCYMLNGEKSLADLQKDAWEALQAEVVLVRGIIIPEFLEHLKGKGYKVINVAHLMTLWTKARQPSDEEDMTDSELTIDLLRKSIYSGNATRKFALVNFALYEPSLIRSFEQQIAHISKVYYLHKGFPEKADMVTAYFYFRGMLVNINVENTSLEHFEKEERATGEQSESWVIQLVGPSMSGKSTIAEFLGLKPLDFSAIMEDTKTALSTEEEPVEELTFSQCIEGVQSALRKTPSETFVIDGLPPQEFLFAKDTQYPLWEMPEASEEALPLEEDPLMHLKISMNVGRFKVLLEKLHILSVIQLECPMGIMEQRLRTKTELTEEDDTPLESKNALLESWAVAQRMKGAEYKENSDIPKWLVLNSEQTGLLAVKKIVNSVFSKQCILVESEFPLGTYLIEQFAWKFQIFYIDFPLLLEEAKALQDELAYAVREGKITLNVKLELLRRKMRTASRRSQFTILSGYSISEDQYSSCLEELTKLEEIVGSLQSLVLFTTAPKDLDMEDLPVKLRPPPKKTEEEDEEKKEEKADDEEEEGKASEEEKEEEVEEERPMWPPSSIYQNFHRLKGRKTNAQNFETKNPEEIFVNLSELIKDPSSRWTLQFVMDHSSATQMLQSLTSQAVIKDSYFNEPLRLEISLDKPESFTFTSKRAQEFFDTQIKFPIVSFNDFFSKLIPHLEEFEIPVNVGSRRAVHHKIDKNQNLFIEPYEIDMMFKILEDPEQRSQLLSLAEDMQGETDDLDYNLLVAFETVSKAPVTELISFPRGTVFEITPEGLPDSPRFCADKSVSFGRSGTQDVKIDDTRVKNFYIQCRDDAYYLVDDGTGLWVQCTDYPITLKTDMMVEIGKHRFRIVECVSPRSKASPGVLELMYRGTRTLAGMPTLKIEFLSEELKGKCFEFSDENKYITIGSLPNNDIVLSETNSLHAVVQLQNTWSIQDMFSATGTLLSVNSYERSKMKKPSLPLALTHNMKIHFSGYSFKTMVKSQVKESVQISDFTMLRHEDFFSLYEITAGIGAGSSSKVYSCRHIASDQESAVKIIPLSMAEQFAGEIESLKQLDHPNIVRLIDAIEDGKNLYIVSELCPGRELFDYIIEQGTVSEEQTAGIAKEVLLALSYIHSKGIVHNDIKPENIIMSERGLKLIDFGSARLVKPPMSEFLGTSYYIAPEVLKKKYNEKRDIWALGVILYIMLSGMPPFNGNGEAEILAKVKSSRARFKEKAWARVSPHAKRVVRSMLTPDINLRPSAADLLEDPWILKSLSFVDVSKTTTVRAFKSLKGFYSFNKLHSALMMFIANNFSSKAFKEEAANVFMQIDVNQDGSLSFEELQNGMNKAEIFVENAELRNVFESIDANSDGKVSYSEFVSAFFLKREAQSRGVLEHAFEAFDADGGGEISAKELKEVLGGTEEYWEQMIADIDENRNGKIDIKEFKNLLLAHLYPDN